MAAIFFSVTEVLSVALGVALWIKCPPEPANSAEAPEITAGRAQMLRQFLALGCCVECYWLLLLATATCVLRHVLDAPGGHDGQSLSISAAILLAAGTCMLSSLVRFCFLGRWRTVATALTPLFRCMCKWATGEEHAALVCDHSTLPGELYLDGNPNAFLSQTEHAGGENIVGDSPLSDTRGTRDVNVVRAKRLEFLQKTQQR